MAGLVPVIHVFHDGAENLIATMTGTLKALARRG
jgi:hypothetical protein